MMTDHGRRKNDPDFFDDEEDFGGGSLGISNIVKKVIVGGATTLFVGQEVARGILKEMKLPKEILDGLLANANKAKKEFLDSLSAEVVKMAEKVDVAEEAKDFLRNHKVNMNVSFTFEKLDSAKDKSK